MKLRYTLLMLLMCVGIILHAQTGRSIIEKVYDRPDGDTRSSEFTMKLINKRGKERSRKIASYSMDVGKQMKDTKTMMFFEYPGDVKGTGFLTWDYDDVDKEDDKWLYLPAMKKTRRISGSSAKKDFFMGSDFTYDDMGSRNIDEDTHKLLREETLNGCDCWVVESVSKDRRDIYSRKLWWIRKDINMAIKVDYYDRSNQIQRRLVVSDIKKIDGFWIGCKLHMKNLQSKHQTIMVIENPKFNVAVNKNDFTVSKLERGSL
ncbi:outer membrane lipoprotein-sorting protein [Halosquirtibacter laminarini]|uniref:Outer membrane lipoprotein-sorting protein n=1 Tax=Halosquirtibacter laminarini TaxID=3374600 RepID=A0AC61NIQ0_9BACT|nr:outer membrane lipoprotein-sorting protein [Prolixibacteraceae bacterium]